MKKWKIIYWLMLNKTEWIITAPTKDEARKKFYQEKGDNIEIIQVIEAKSTEHN